MFSRKSQIFFDPDIDVLLQIKMPTGLQILR